MGHRLDYIQDLYTLYNLHICWILNDQCFLLNKKNPTDLHRFLHNISSTFFGGNSVKAIASVGNWWPAMVFEKHGWRWLEVGHHFFWLVVEPTHLKNMSQIESFPQVGVNIKNIWNHHLVLKNIEKSFGI